MANPIYETRHQCKTYRVNGVPFIPHYSIPGLFVGPGGVEVNATRLEAQGAIPSVHLLWMREWAVETKLQAE